MKKREWLWLSFLPVLYVSVLKPGDTRALPSQLTWVVAPRPSLFACSHLVRSTTCSGMCRRSFFLSSLKTQKTMNQFPLPICTHKKTPPKSKCNFLPPGLPHLLQCWPAAINCFCWSLGFCCFAFAKRQVCSRLGWGCSVFWGWDSEFPVSVLLISILPGSWELVALCNETDSPSFWEYLVRNSYP